MVLTRVNGGGNELLCGGMNGRSDLRFQISDCANAEPAMPI
jgi:hypothetical protein